MRRLGILALLGLALASCSTPIEGDLTAVCADTSHEEASYFDEVMAEEFFEVHCTVCHSRDLPEGVGPGSRRGAPLSFNYNTHEGATLLPEATWDRIADRTMPPMGREVDDAEAALVKEWLGCQLALQQLPEGDDDDSAR